MVQREARFAESIKYTSSIENTKEDESNISKILTIVEMIIFDYIGLNAVCCRNYFRFTFYLKDTWLLKFVQV